MKITRVYTGVDGESLFDEMEVETEKLQLEAGIVFRQAGIRHLDGST
jgi:hypothetical protein